MQAVPPPASLVTDRMTLPGDPPSSEFAGINDRGDVVANGDDGKRNVAYVGHAPYGHSSFERIFVPGSAGTTATGINNAGTIVGFYADGASGIAAFSERDGAYTREHAPGGSKAMEYLGVNDSGSIVGYYADGRGVRHAFVRNVHAGRLVSIRPSGSSSVTASAINADGDVVGYMTSGRGDVRGFLWRGGHVTELAYPGAVETKALGIAQDGRIVGSYKDSSGATHAFIRHPGDAMNRWQTFDDARAEGLTVLTGLNSSGRLVGYYADRGSHVRALLSHVVNPQLSKIPLVIPVWGYGGDFMDTDPGATPDQHLFAAVVDNSEDSSKSLAKNCPGVSASSTCQPYKYVNFALLHCNTPDSLAAYQWADANDEHAFQHLYPGSITSANRITYNATPNPTCVPHSHNAEMRMNVGDSGYNNYLYQNVWNGSDYQKDFPAPYGGLEDQGSTFAGIVVGGMSQVSTEYGSGTNPSGFANHVGNSRYHAATDWETAMGLFVNGACRSKCVDMAINGVATGAGNVGPCSVISNGHCHAQYQSGLIDNQAAIDDTCKTVTGGNLKYFMAERPIFAGRFGFGFLNGQTMTVDINTAANLYTHTSDGCANTKIIDLEPSWGLGGLGDVLGGHLVRLTTLAYRWMVPNPATGIPDRVIAHLFSIGGTLKEVPYFFEETLVPYGPEQPVSRYVWNGKVQTTGGGCPSPQGDTGGAVALRVQCVGSDAVYCQQYQHLYINGADYGNVAACLNTSTRKQNIVSSWFKHDPISSYKYVLALKGGEMTSVPYAGVQGGSIALSTCKNVLFCTGSSKLSDQVAPFKGNGSDTLCGPCGVILLHKN
ncbi:MAG: hypothetical protein JO324_09135 [Candidatus Eremiobacteraeota bacterium]|nr:hypothetical protein [Candidatus Eremiobacteraeota bacterium]